MKATKGLLSVVVRLPPVCLTQHILLQVPPDGLPTDAKTQGYRREIYRREDDRNRKNKKEKEKGKKGKKQKKKEKKEKKKKIPSLPGSWMLFRTVGGIFFFFFFKSAFQ